MKDIAKKANTMYLLEKYNMKATKKFGQNFLIDLNVIQKLWLVRLLINKLVLLKLVQE